MGDTEAIDRGGQPAAPDRGDDYAFVERILDEHIALQPDDSPCHIYCGREPRILCSYHDGLVDGAYAAVERYADYRRTASLERAFHDFLAYAESLLRPDAGELPQG